MKKNKLIVIGLIVCLLIGGIALYRLIQSPDKVLKQQIMAMNGLNVNLDFIDAVSFKDGKDTVFQSSSMKKLIIFVDSTSCSSCFLGKLIEYFEINDTLTSKHSQLAVVLNPRDSQRNDVILRLRNERFPFWCIVDQNGDFLRNNQFIPDNQLLHTFTLDEEDKIILIGDPTRNSKIRELFLKIL